MKLALLLGIIIQLIGASVSVVAYKKIGKDKLDKTSEEEVFKIRMDRLIWTESRGHQWAKSRRKGKSKAYTKYQINGHGLQYFNHFNLIKTIVDNGKLRHVAQRYTMKELVKSERKSKIVSEWIIKKAKSHYQRIRPDHADVFSYNSYNMGYGNTAKNRFHPDYVKSIIPFKWYKFTVYYEPYKTKGKSVWYRRRRPHRLKGNFTKLEIVP